jgi:hypothetical protein
MKTLKLLVGVSVIAGVAFSAPGTAAAITGNNPRATPARRSCRGIAWHTLRDGTQYCPSTHSMLSDVGWVKLTWSSWGGPIANGRGYEDHRNYTPDGIRFEELTPIGIRLSGPKQCSRRLRIYSWITVTYYEASEGRNAGRESRHIPCNGETGGGNG